MTPCFGSINLLEWLKKLRKKSLLTRLQVYYKIQEQSDRRDAQGRVEKGQGTSKPSPGTPLSPNFHVLAL